MIIKPKYGICTDCPEGSEEVMLKKIHPPLCLSHYNERKREEKKSKGKTTPFTSSKKKVTGEMEVFKMIWAEREHKCQCCGNPLGDELKPIFFSHILPKSIYGLFRLLKENIWLCCELCHISWDAGSRGLEVFKEKRIVAEQLKIKYNEKNGIHKLRNETIGS